MIFIEDDGGRAAAGFKGRVDDCVVRAIAITSGLPYAEVYKRLADGNASQGGKRSARNGVDAGSEWFEAYMMSLGFEWVMTSYEIDLRQLPTGRLVVLVFGSHAVAVINGVIYGTYDCSWGGNRCIRGLLATRAG
jgi:hypothetical protein